MKKFLIVLFIIILGCIFFFLTIRGVEGNPGPWEFKNNLDQATKPFELSPERGRYAHVFSLAEDNHYYLTEEWAEAVYPDVGYSQGKFYSFFAPGISYLTYPFYSWGKAFGLGQVFAFGFVALCAILNMVFLFLISNSIFKLPKSLSLFAALTFAFATTSWSYAITLYQHHTFTLLVLSAFYCVWRYGQNTRFSWLWGFVVWLNYGLAILIDYPNALLMLPIMVYFLMSSLKFANSSEKLTFSVRWSLILTSVFFLAITAFHGYHNQEHFGSWKNLSGGIIGYKQIKEGNLFNSENPEQAIAELQAKKNVVKFFSEERFPSGLYTLLVSRDRGLFFYSPILLLGLFGLFLIRKKIFLEHGILIGLIAVNLFLYSSWADPWGGWAYGPRYLIPVMAILAIYVAIFIYQFKYRIFGRILAFVLFIYSLAVGAIGAITTNAVPPKIEADFLNTKYNFFYNWLFVKAGRSGSYVYNTYLSQDMTVLKFGIAILVPIAVIALIILLVSLRSKNAESINQ